MTRISKEKIVAKNSRIQRWSTHWAFIWATAGAAIGLGNIWKFPYTLGENGGSAFMLVYLISVFVIGVPLMLAEALIGRYARQNAVDSIIKIARESHASRYWQLAGWWGLLALVMILSFYSVVSGWSIAYLWRSAAGYLQGLGNAEIESVWVNFLDDPLEMLLWHSVFMLLTLWVVARGVESGLEKLNRYLMPGLFAVLIILVLYAAYAGEFVQGLKFLFMPDFSKITAGVILSALGQAFFSLALGAGMITVYAAYSQDNTSLTHSMSTIAILNVIVAVLAGLAIFPIVFAYGLPVSEGPGLMYVVLPMAFAHMEWGVLIGSLFFVLLLFAAWTSSISLAEPVVYLLIERTQLSRKQATWLVCGFAWILGIGSLLSFNLWEDVQLGGFTIFAIATDIPTNIILPTGGLLFALFVGWVMKRSLSEKILQMKSDGMFQAWYFSMRFLVPLMIGIVFITSLMIMIK